MKGSWKLGTFAGIGVFVHWTFSLLLLWVAGVYLFDGRGLPAIVEVTALLLAVFTCVVLHEFGHALTARRYGIVTRDITLLPIGGLARLERIPENPVQELLIALAGPAVNVLIAGVLLGVLALFGEIDRLTEVTILGGHFLAVLLMVNIFLAAFNLLPAFPMDGGRVLRALLATKLSYSRATDIAAGVGRGMAVLFAVAGVFYDWWLLLIAAFVYLAADGEAQFVHMRSLFKGATLAEAMTTHYAAVTDDQTIDDAVSQLKSTSQHDLPVVADGCPVGLLTGNDVVRAIGDGRRDAPVRLYMHNVCPTAPESAPLQESYNRMLAQGCRTLPVVRDGQLVGIVTRETINTWASIREAGERRRQRQPHASAGRNGDSAERILPSPRDAGQRMNSPGGVSSRHVPAPRNWHGKCT